MYHWDRRSSMARPKIWLLQLQLGRSCLYKRDTPLKPFQCWRYFHPKHKDTKIFENHLYPVMLVFIRKLSPSSFRWVPMCQGFNQLLTAHQRPAEHSTARPKFRLLWLWFDRSCRIIKICHFETHKSCSKVLEFLAFNQYEPEGGATISQIPAWEATRKCINVK